MPFDWNDVAPGPTADQIEISLFGPGYGESVVAHLGGGHWIIVDSCLDKQANTPAALAYLAAIGVSPASVDLVIATHWHDDHVRGIGRTIEACSSASFCCSAALRTSEFITFIKRQTSRNPVQGGSGATEMAAVLDTLEARGAALTAANADRRIRLYPSGTLGHPDTCSVWTLSPSDQQYSRFLASLGALMPQLHQTKGRAISQSPNDFCAVVLIEWGTTAALLGADLEVSATSGIGWAAIVDSTGRPTGTSAVFKVAHHGSRTGHYADVWTEMLEPNVHAILTPYNRGSKLPSPADVRRIVDLTPNAYITSRASAGTGKRRDPAVVRTLKEANIRITSREQDMGMIRMRRNSGHPWSVELINQACPLRDLNAA